MASSSIFITATEARQNPIRESVIHDEARAIETAILEAVKNGFYQATLSGGSPMTGFGAVNMPVVSVDLVTNALYIPAHPFKTSDIVTVTSTGTLPSPLVSTNYYSVIYIDADHIKLAASPSDATNARPIDVDFTVGVTSVNVTNNGAGYLNVPAVNIAPPLSGNAATAISTLSSYGLIDSIGVLSAGSGYTTIPAIEINSVGTGAVAGTVRFLIVGVSVSAGGTGYRVGDIIQPAGGAGNIPRLVVSSTGAAGDVTEVSLQYPGSYISLPSLSNCATGSVTPSVGQNCTVNLVMGIESIDVASGGINYVSPPVVTITGGFGAGAKATAIINSGSVIGFNITENGSGYTSSPTVELTSGSGASAIAVLQPTGVSRVTVENDGSGSYASVPNVTLTAQGAGAVIDTVTMKIVSATIGNRGGGYNKGDILLIAGGAGTLNASIQVTGVGSLGEILSYALITSGSYTTLPILNNNSVIGGTGNSATFNLRTGVEAVSLASGGTGYAASPTVVITPVDGNGAGATAYTRITSTSVSEIVVEKAGTGYTAIPNIAITSGSGATATAVINAGSITEIVVTSAGTNYTSPPVVTIDGTGTAYASLTPTGIAKIEITNPGSGYTTKPLIQVIDGPNNWATTVQPATVVNIGYSVETVSVVSSGSGYNSVPEVSIASPNGTFGSQALADANLGAGTGTIFVSLYQNSRDYWKVWKNQTPSDALYVRPYQERMDTVIAYFTNLGYTINRQTNPATGNTIQWAVMW